MQLLKNVFTAHKKWDLERNIPDWREWQLLLVKWTTRLLLLDSLRLLVDKPKLLKIDV